MDCEKPFGLEMISFRTGPFVVDEDVVEVTSVRSSWRRWVRLAFGKVLAGDLPELCSSVNLGHVWLV